MKSSKSIFSFGELFMCLLLLAAVSGHAETTQQKGQLIATTVMKRDEGYGGFKATAKMTLFNANGKASI